MPNCRFFHTFEKNILVTVKNWWSLSYGQVYILSIDDRKRTVFLSTKSSFSNSVSRKAFPPIAMLPLNNPFSQGLYTTLTETGSSNEVISLH